MRRGLLFAARLGDGLRNRLLERRAGNRRARNAVHIRALRVEHRLRHAGQRDVAQTGRLILADHVDGRHRVRIEDHIHHNVAAHAFGTLAIGSRRIRTVCHTRNRARHEQERENGCCRLLHRFSSFSEYPRIDCILTFAVAWRSRRIFVFILTFFVSVNPLFSCKSLGSFAHFHRKHHVIIDFTA